MDSRFVIEYVELPNGRIPAREFVDSLDETAAARTRRLRGPAGRLRRSDAREVVKKLTQDIFELRVKQHDRIFRVLFFYQPGRLIVITSGFQKRTERTPPAEIARAERLRRVWLKYRNRYTGLPKEMETILKEFGP